MVSDDPRAGGDPDDEFGRQPPERDTEPIPPYRGAAAYGAVQHGDVIEFDDIEFAHLGVPPPTIGFEDRADLIATKEPSDLVRRYLYPTEKFRGEWRRHWIHLVKRLMIGVLATFALGYLSGYFAKQNVASGLTILVIVWILVMSWVLWDVAEWYYDRFILTNKRVMLIEGIVSRKVAMMPLSRVTDMKYTQSPMGRVLGYGSFEIESAGQDQALRNVQNLPNPTDLYLQVVEEMYEPEASEARRRPAKVDDGS
ncbi:MAG TPA: PH domain-containing protein [Micromonosporaceae bacterium]